MNDSAIRQALRAELACRYASSDPGTLIIDELPICRHAARADLAVINGHFSGYEIKSDRDTLKRLGSQVEAYCRVFDYVTVVTAPNHIDRVFLLLPPSWGIIEAFALAGGVRFRPLREASANAQQSPLAVCQLLWRAEALDILETHGLSGAGRTGPRRKLWERIAEAVPLDELRPIVAAKLKARAHWRVAPSRT